jgi:hypothetical protein
VSTGSVLFGVRAKFLGLFAGKPATWVGILTCFLSAFLAGFAVVVGPDLVCGRITEFWDELQKRLVSSILIGVGYSASGIAFQLLRTCGWNSKPATPVKASIDLILLCFLTMAVNMGAAAVARTRVVSGSWPANYKWIRDGFATMGYCFVYQLFNAYVDRFGNPEGAGFTSSS